MAKCFLPNLDSHLCTQPVNINHSALYCISRTFCLFAAWIISVFFTYTVAPCFYFLPKCFTRRAALFISCQNILQNLVGCKKQKKRNGKDTSEIAPDLVGQRRENFRKKNRRTKKYMAHDCKILLRNFQIHLSCSGIHRMYSGASPRCLLRETPFFQRYVRCILRRFRSGFSQPCLMPDNERFAKA